MPPPGMHRQQVPGLWLLSIVAMLMLTAAGWNTLLWHERGQRLEKRLSELQVVLEAQQKHNQQLKDSLARIGEPVEQFGKPAQLAVHARPEDAATSLQLSRPVADAGAAGGGAAHLTKSGKVVLDLVSLIGIDKYVAGVSYQPFHCCPPLKEVFPADQQAIRQKLLQTLVEAAARIKGVRPEDIDITNSYWNNVKGRSGNPRDMLLDPQYPKWVAEITLIFSRFLVNPNEERSPYVLCPTQRPLTAKTLASDLPLKACDLPADELYQQMGRYGAPHLPIEAMVNGGMDGMCTTPPSMEGADTYGELYIQRMFNPKWRTFATSNPDMDALLYMMDLKYEVETVFAKQRWNGITAMQQPFDFVVISNLIYALKPALIIETGTANGGSALMWASVLELAGLSSSRIVTMDLNVPGGELAFGRGSPADDPKLHPLWKKYITFIKGLTTANDTVRQVKEVLAAQNPQVVLVLLDSSHAHEDVYAEMNAFCPLVTVGSYCIVEDTKLSRMILTDRPGPLTAVHKWLPEHPEFRADRQQELFYTQHAQGYLIRDR